MLTDAELAVVSRRGSVAVTPAWDRLTPAERGRAAREAGVTLVARGLVDPGDPVRAGLHPDLRAVLALRVGAGAVVSAHRATACGADQWYAHLVEDVVLLEEVSAAGRHRFALAHREDLEGMVVAAALHPAAVGGRSSSTPDADHGVLVDLLVAVRRGPVRQVSLLSGPRGTWRLTRQRAVPVTVPRARRLIAAQLPRSGEVRPG